MVDRTLRKVGLKSRDFKNRRKGLRKIQAMSRAPESRDAILQAANELAVAQAVQLQDLGEIGMKQIELKGSMFASEQEQATHSREAMRRALQAPRLYRGNEKKY